MTALNDAEFIAASRSVATSFLDSAARFHLSPSDTAKLAGAGLGEVMAQQIGIPATVEQLRNMADLFEQVALDSLRNG